MDYKCCTILEMAWKSGLNGGLQKILHLAPYTSLCKNKNRVYFYRGRFRGPGVGFFGAHHSNPIFMPFPKWYNTFSPHLTWRLSLFFRRVNVIHILGPIYSLYFAASFSRLLIGKCIQILKQTAWQCWLLLEYIFGTSLKTSKLFCLLSIVVFRF